MVWGWVVVAFFTTIVGLAMAEICSSYPTSGGLYFWSASLATERWKPFASWMTGWFNLIGQFAVTAGIDFGLALMLAATVSIGTDFTYTPTPGTVIGFHAAIVFSHGLANSLGPKLMRYIMTVSTWWQVVAPIVLIITILAKAPSHQSASFVFGGFENQTGWHMPGYVVLIALLQAQYTLTGYDASAHMTEETTNASVSGPFGIVSAIGVSAVVGFLFIVGLLFCIQDYNVTIASPTGFPVAQILLDCTGKSGAIVLMIIIMLACWFCGFSSVTANSRMIYAFSRDGAIPGSKWWHVIHKGLQTPLNAVWLACFVAFCLALPYLGNTTAYSAVTSVATTGLYLSYGMPILVKLRNPSKFERGPFHLGRFSTLLGWIAVLWIALITILFVLPTTNPVTPVNMNYASVATGGVIIGAFLGWIFSARKWFKGPVANITEAELVGLEEDPTASKLVQHDAIYNTGFDSEKVEKVE
ncbi:hypothetical protein BZG36_01751 [Bifiguratus adelaidae]|uniref:Uncharacterized protein n=1 Tax=Bifiguratus adelaidae TaxID=1938954 RepID=A0A261Y310_9FUNG|nr:hypothetical protein BZG36_01751 [Bifiguratus adelaidae]